MVRVRFAPSPTGNLHIGSARTALFNWLYARHHNGAFFLRIEDTDRARSSEEYLEEIMGSLKWLFMDWDGEPVFQSKRLESYRRLAVQLLDKGLAYKDGEAIIFRVNNEGAVKFSDLIHGEISVNKEEIKDQVLIKSDGTPTYNFACVADDADMGITHIIRGDDHISNTPKQVLFYEALGFPLPQFAHIPLILSKEGGRMSKRHGATSIFEYRAMGFLPEAMVNFLSLLGWSPKGDKEIISREETIALFDVQDVKKTGAVFDMDKLNWLNGQYIMALDTDEYVRRLTGFLKEKGALPGTVDENKLKEVATLYKERIRILTDFEKVYKIFFNDALDYDEHAVEKHLKKIDRGTFEEWLRELEGLASFDILTIESALRAFAEKKAMKPAKLIHPTRVAVSGQDAGAGLFEMMKVLGKEKVVKRMEHALTTYII